MSVSVAFFKFNFANSPVDAASADDPNEVSLEKDEEMEVLDKKGKWWKVKKTDGTTGSTSQITLFCSSRLTLDSLQLHRLTISCSHEVRPLYCSLKLSRDPACHQLIDLLYE